MLFLSYNLNFPRVRFFNLSNGYFQGTVATRQPLKPDVRVHEKRSTIGGTPQANRADVLAGWPLVPYATRLPMECPMISDR